MVSAAREYVGSCRGVEAEMLLCLLLFGVFDLKSPHMRLFKVMFCEYARRFPLKEDEQEMFDAHELLLEMITNKNSLCLAPSVKHQLQRLNFGCSD